MSKFGLRTMAGYAVSGLLAMNAAAATWTAGNGDYGVPTNWDGLLVPCEELSPLDSAAVIDSAVTVTQNVVMCTAQSLDLGASATLSLASGTQYTTGNADIAGRISGVGGDFEATGTTLSGISASLAASLGSSITLDATSWMATSSPNSNFTRISATGGGSSVALSQLSNLNAGFNSSSLGAQVHYATASDGGSIDLSGLTSVTGPVDPEDRFEFLLEDSGSAIALNSLSTVVWRVAFRALTDGAMTLPALSSVSATFVAESAAQIDASASSWTLTDLLIPNQDADILRARNAGSMLDLSGMTALSAAFNSSSLGSQVHYATVYDNGTLDLSGLADVSGPIDEEDWFEFRIEGSGASLLLDSLSTINRLVVFRALTGSTLALPALTDVGAQFVAESGSQIVANASSWTLDRFGWVNRTGDVLRAKDPGSLLDLSGMTVLDASFNSSSVGSQVHYATVLNGGTLNLSGLTDISGPIDEEDWFEFRIEGSESSILLDSLSTINRLVVFRALSGSTLVLPGLTAVSAQLVAESGSQIVANASPWTLNQFGWQNRTGDILRAKDTGSLLDLSAMTTLDAGFNSSSVGTQTHFVTAVDGGVIDLSGLTGVFGPVDPEDSLTFLVDGSAAAIWLDSLASVNQHVQFRTVNAGELDLPSLSTVGARFVAESGSRISATDSVWTLTDFGLANFTLDLLRARNPGSLLDVSGMRTLNAGFNSSSLGAQVHTVRADDSGVVDLRGVNSLIGPQDPEDSLALLVESDGTMILGPLANVSGTGGVTLTLQPPGTRAQFPRSLDADDKIAVVANADTAIEVTGSLSFRHSDAARFDLEAARVYVDGPQEIAIEVGGQNDGAVLPTDSNFGFGQLIVGSALAGASARLVDLVDNGNGSELCGLGRESLYLYGFDAGPDADGLRLLNGATLNLSGLELYAAIGGVLMHINPMLTPGVPFPYDEGFIELGVPFDIDLDGVLDGVDNCVLEFNPDQADTDMDGYGNACDGDLNGDLFVNGLDLGAFKSAFFTTPASPNWNPDADFNNDQVVNAIDLGILKLLFFAPPGPSCPVPMP